MINNNIFHVGVLRMKHDVVFRWTESLQSSFIVHERNDDLIVIGCILLPYHNKVTIVDACIDAVADICATEFGE